MTLLINRERELIRSLITPEEVTPQQGANCMADVERPALHNQNVVVAFYGEDGGYFVGRQTPELAAETAVQLGQIPHKILEVIDCSDDPAMAEIIADDLRTTYADNYQVPEPYKI